MTSPSKLTIAVELQGLWWLARVERVDRRAHVLSWGGEGGSRTNLRLVGYPEKEKLQRFVFLRQRNGLDKEDGTPPCSPLYSNYLNEPFCYSPSGVILQTQRGKLGSFASRSGLSEGYIQRIPQAEERYSLHPSSSSSFLQLSLIAHVTAWSWLSPPEIFLFSLRSSMLRKEAMPSSWINLRGALTTLESQERYTIICSFCRTKGVYF